MAASSPSHYATASRLRVRRRAAVVDLHAPPLAVWAGEVVVVAGPGGHALVSRLTASHAAHRGRLLAVTLAVDADVSTAARALTRAARAGAAVLVASEGPADAPGAACRSAALLRAVARGAPARCVWYAGDGAGDRP